MICQQRGKEVYRMFSRLRDGKWADGCKDCWGGYSTIVDADANQTYYVSRVPHKGRIITRRYTRGDIRHMDNMAVDVSGDNHRMVPKSEMSRKSFVVNGYGNR